MNNFIEEKIKEFQSKFITKCWFGAVLGKAIGAGSQMEEAEVALKWLTQSLTSAYREGQHSMIGITPFKKG